MLAIEPGSGNGGDEELAAVGVRACEGEGVRESFLGRVEARSHRKRRAIATNGTSVGHVKEKRHFVLLLEIFVSKLLAIDGLTAGAVSAGEVTTLEHELGDDAVEGGALVVERLARLSDTLFTRAECAEVLSGLRNLLTEQAEHNTTSGLTVDLNVKEHLVGDLHLLLLQAHRHEHKHGRTHTKQTNQMSTRT